jgi:hypothetical protein
MTRPSPARSAPQRGRGWRAIRPARQEARAAPDPPTARPCRFAPDRRSPPVPLDPHGPPQSVAPNTPWRKPTATRGRATDGSTHLSTPSPVSGVLPGGYRPLFGFSLGANAVRSRGWRRHGYSSLSSFSRSRGKIWSRRHWIWLGQALWGSPTPSWAPGPLGGRAVGEGQGRNCCFRPKRMVTRTLGVLIRERVRARAQMRGRQSW